MSRFALVLGLTLAAATPAVAGPPWLTLEFRPGNFAGFVLVHTFHHGTPQAMPLTGTAEGLVGGERRSVVLRFEPGDEANLQSVANTWGSAGVWVLNIAATGEHGTAGAVVGIDHSGQAAFTRFPRTVTGTSRAATPREIDAMLRALDGGTPPPALGQTGWGILILRTTLPLVILGAAALGVLRLGAGILARVRRQPSAAPA